MNENHLISLQNHNLLQEGNAKDFQFICEGQDTLSIRSILDNLFPKLSPKKSAQLCCSNDFTKTISQWPDRNLLFSIDLPL